MTPQRHSERGASLAETAIAMTVVLLFLMGIIDFGRAIYAYDFTATIAREGARWAIVRGANCSLLDHCNASSSDIQTYVQSLNEGATPGTIGVTTSWPSCSAAAAAGSKAKNAPGCTVSVAVSYPFNFLLPMMSGTTITMTSSSVMVISQ